MNIHAQYHNMSFAHFEPKSRRQNLIMADYCKKEGTKERSWIMDIVQNFEMSADAHAANSNWRMSSFTFHEIFQVLCPWLQ